MNKNMELRMVNLDTKKRVKLVEPVLDFCKGLPLKIIDTVSGKITYIKEPLLDFINFKIRKKEKRKQ